ncbi:HRDC domain-containing protein, partial [Staphylococcus sp. EG-SA-29]|nr:HRDC domain-containing protein [Staphylococcus sp. EG-SA-29]
GEEDREVFERLRAWRTEQAREQGVPAYVVFPDATLIELARARPSSSAALAEVSGVGAKKLERYGEAVLRVLA